MQAQTSNLDTVKQATILNFSCLCTDEGQADEEKLQQLASTLLEKWSTLKEVFRIPKRVTPVSLCQLSN